MLSIILSANNECTIKGYNIDYEVGYIISIYKYTLAVIIMTNNFYLTGTLSDFQLKILNLIQCLHNEVKNASKSEESIITLQQNYIAPLVGCSPNSINNAIKRLCQIGIISRINNEFGHCSTYRYNTGVYYALINEAKKRTCKLSTGFWKGQRNESAGTIFSYMKGKAIKKGASQ